MSFVFMCVCMCCKTLTDVCITVCASHADLCVCLCERESLTDLFLLYLRLFEVCLSGHPPFYRSLTFGKLPLEPWD